MKKQKHLHNTLGSVQDINFDFVTNYWNINNGEERITGITKCCIKLVKILGCGT